MVEKQNSRPATATKAVNAVSDYSDGGDKATSKGHYTVGIGKRQGPSVLRWVGTLPTRSNCIIWGEFCVQRWGVSKTASENLNFSGSFWLLIGLRVIRAPAWW